MYVYVGNNPVNYVDPTGHERNSLTVLLCPNCVFGAGHIAFLIADDKDATYYSFAPDGPPGHDSAPFGPGKVTSQTYEGMAEKATEELVATVNAKERPPDAQYTVGLQFSNQAPENIANAITFADQKAAENPDYNLIWRNCLTFVKQVLKEAKVNTALIPPDPTPNGWFVNLDLAHLFDRNAHVKGLGPQ